MDYTAALLVFPIRETFKNLLVKTSGQICKLFGTNLSGVNLYQSCSNYFDPLKNMALAFFSMHL